MKILVIIVILVVIFIVRVTTRKRGFRINEYEKNGLRYYTISTDTLLIPFLYHEGGMLFGWGGRIDFDFWYGKDKCNRFTSKESALARINAWRKRELGGVILGGYKIVERGL